MNKLKRVFYINDEHSDDDEDDINRGCHSLIWQLHLTISTLFFKRIINADESIYH